MGSVNGNRPGKGGRVTMMSDFLILQRTTGGYWDMTGLQVYRIFAQGYQNTGWLACDSWPRGAEGAEQEMEPKN